MDENRTSEALDEFGEALVFLYEWSLEQGTRLIYQPRLEREVEYVSRIANMSAEECYLSGWQRGIENVLHDFLSFLQEGRKAKLLLLEKNGTYIDVSASDMDVNSKLFDWLDEKSKYKTQISFLTDEDASG